MASGGKLMNNETKPLRVLVFANSMVSPITTSGGDKRFLEIFKRLGGNGSVDLFVMTSKSGYVRCIQEPVPVKKYIVLAPTKFERLGYAAMFLARTVQALAQVSRRIPKVDLFYTASDFLPDVSAAAKIRRRQDGHWVAMVHHLIAPPHRRVGFFWRNLISYLAQQLSLQLIRRADVVFVTNAGVRQELIRRGFSRDKVIVVLLGINPEEFQGSFCKQQFDACFMARFDATKGVFDVPSIWKEVVRTHPNAKLAMIGTHTPAQRQKLESELVRRCIGDNISILGYLPRVEAIHVLRSSRIFITPSYEEGWGISVAEAMAAGRPVVAYDLPVFREIFPSGMVRVLVGDKRAFGQAVSHLLSFPEEACMLANQALSIAAKFDWDIVAASELELFQQLVQPKLATMENGDQEVDKNDR